MGGLEGRQRLGELMHAGRKLRVSSAGALLLHTGRPIQDDDRRVGTPAGRQSEPAAREGTADGENQAGDRQHPGRHDQVLPQPGEPSGHPVGRQQEHHRSPADRLVTPLVDEVNDDRQERERERGQQPGLQEAHREPLPWARPTREPRQDSLVVFIEQHAVIVDRRFQYDSPQFASDIR